MTPIGIMQGRLLPPVGGRIQAFPGERWREEFPLAAEAGLACIEWIYEAGSDRVNPLDDDAGLREIAAAVESSGVAVSSVCADYFMPEHLVGADGHPQGAQLERLQWLVGRAARVGARYVVLPFVDESSLDFPAARAGLLEVLRSALGEAERHDVELHLETDLPTETLVEVLDEIAHPLVRANYDSGNSASLGRRPDVELPALGRRVGSVHVKDRLVGGGTVPLGSGDADLATALRLVAESDFAGPYILQVAREAGVSEVELAQRNRALVESLLPAEARD